MDREALAEELRGIIEKYLNEHGLELVDMILRYEGPDLFLRLSLIHI